MLKARPGVFAAGEMLDWDAPTGGYLLQASFATGRAAARGASAGSRVDQRRREGGRLPPMGGPPTCAVFWRKLMRPRSRS